jgi:hypothetical protein
MIARQPKQFGQIERHFRRRTREIQVWPIEEAQFNQRASGGRG